MNCYTVCDGGVLLNIRLTPNARKNALLAELYISGDAKTYLKAAVTAVPEDGKANKALTKLLAKTLKIAPSHITLKQGETHRNKTFYINTLDTKIDTQNLISRITALTEEGSA